MQLHDQFEWDHRKAETNRKRHRLSFDTAAIVLADGRGDFYHFEQHDQDHSATEDRYITVASYPEDRNIVLLIVWTEREENGNLLTRIISARHATLNERKQYAEYIAEKNRS